MNIENTRIRFNYEGRTTSCIIENADREVIAQQSVTRYAKDIPNKLLARKEAFRRTMTQVAENNLLDKQLRSNIWNGFRTQIKQPILN